MITKEYEKSDGIFIFTDNARDEDYCEDGLDNLYKHENKHFWFKTRKDVILDAFQSFSKKNDNILEVGAGTGNVSRHLTKNGFVNISIGEMHSNGLRYAKSYGIEKLYQFDLMDPPFKGEFDAIGMFDVLEHISEDKLALSNVNRMLCSEGLVYITVPAHDWLWSADDVFAKHKKRYTKPELSKLLNSAGFEVINIKYFYTFITPLLFLRRILNPAYKANSKYSTTDSLRISPLPNFVLNQICKFENWISNLVTFPFGGSILAVAKAVKQ